MDAKPAPTREAAAGYPVARRLALIFPGFESLPVEAFARRFTREAERTAPVYGMSLSIAAEPAGTVPDGVEVACLAADASGDGWRTRSDIVHYALTDHSYSQRSDIVRLASGLGALADFVATGTFFRFVRTSWRYGLFFAYPIVMTLVIAAFTLAVMWLPFRWWGGIALVASIPLGVAVFLAGVRIAASQAHLLLMMDDWAVARDIARGRNPEVARRIGAIAADAEARIRASEATEIVFAAHSFGTFTAIFSLAGIQKSGAARGRPIGLLTVGSSLLKIALHPAAKDLRAATAAVMAAGTPWLDVQSLTDPINFYKSDPARDLKISGGRRPNAIRVRFRSQLTPQSYRAMRRDLFRTHRQFVYAVERRHPYAFHAILCGPEPFDAVATRGGLLEEWPARGPA
jgi:hypothetical protein